MLWMLRRVARWALFVCAVGMLLGFAVCSAPLFWTAHAQAPTTVPPPGPPSSVSLMAGGSQGELVLSWSAPSTTNGPITGYRWAVTGPAAAEGTTDGTATTATAMMLYDGTYTGTVWASNATGEGEGASTAPLTFSNGSPTPTPIPRPTGLAPEQIHWRDKFCLEGGFPGCPDSYVFLVPTVVGLMVGGAQRAAKQNPGRGRRRQQNSNHEPVLLGVAIVASFVFTGIVMGVNPLKMVLYFMVPLAITVLWWVWRRG